jgi:hypothetical protein
MANRLDTMTRERRKSNRLKLRDDSFAVLKFKGPVIGKINDISKSGASILYFQSKGFSDEQPFIDIFTSDNSFVLQHIPFRTISDSQIDVQFNLGKTVLRKKGIMFGKLSASQRAELKYFIRAYAVALSHNVVKINFSQQISENLPPMRLMYLQTLT